MTKQRFLLIASLLFLAFAAHAQEGTFCSFAPYGSTDQTLAFLETGPAFGFLAYSCPVAPSWQSFSLTRQWYWTSTCPQGGILIQTVAIAGNDTQINVASGIFDPFTGRQLGIYNGFGYVSNVGGLALPAFIPTNDQGFLCNPAARDGRYQSLVTETQ